MSWVLGGWWVDVPHLVYTRYCSETILPVQICWVGAPLCSDMVVGVYCVYSSADLLTLVKYAWSEYYRMGICEYRIRVEQDNLNGIQ